MKQGNDHEKEFFVTNNIGCSIRDRTRYSTRDKVYYAVRVLDQAYYSVIAHVDDVVGINNDMIWIDVCIIILHKVGDYIKEICHE